MIFTRIADADLLADTDRFRPSEVAHIHEKLDDGYFVVALEYLPEQGEDAQYPMEDVLDRYMMHIEEFDIAPGARPGAAVDLFANSELDRLQTAVQELVGRRAHNVTTLGEDGEESVGLAVDDSVDAAHLQG